MDAQPPCLGIGSPGPVGPGRAAGAVTGAGGCTGLASVAISAQACCPPSFGSSASLQNWGVAKFCLQLVDAMDLPQTQPGVPAPGVDPTVEELAAINGIAGIFDWLGTAQPVRDALLQALGGMAPRLRDLVYIKCDGWDSTVTGLEVMVPGVLGADADPRALTPIEEGHISMVRRIARLRLGLTAIEHIPVATVPVGGLGFGGPSATPLGALVLPTIAPPAGEPRLKLSSILDPSLDTELMRLPQPDIRKLFANYEDTRGAEPSEDIEPTVEQISAVAQVLKADLTPYADFAVYGPHGRRLLQKLTYMAWTYLPDGSWQRRELQGPPSFEHWWASFRVLRTTYLLLDAVATETLDNYGELIRGFVSQYGDGVWFLVYNADVRMRAERFQRLRRHAERDHALATAAGRQSAFDLARPWNTVFSMALVDKDWWEENVHRAALLYLGRIKSAAQVLDDGTSQPSSFSAGSVRASAGTSARRTPRSRTPQREPAGRPRGPGDDGAVYTKKGKRFCDDFNTSQGCSKGRACPDLHACKGCKAFGHPTHKCTKGVQGKKQPQQGGASRRKW